MKKKIIKNKDIPKCFDYSDYWIEKEKYSSVLQYVKQDKYICKCFLYLGLQVKKKITGEHPKNLSRSLVIEQLRSIMTHAVLYIPVHKLIGPSC